MGYFCYVQMIEYFRNSFHFKKDGAKPPARRGCSAYASESNIQKYSICNFQFRLVRIGLWVDPPGGEGGIRTHDPAFDRILLFESRAFSRSATSPQTHSSRFKVQGCGYMMGRSQYTFCLRLSTIFGTMTVDQKPYFKTCEVELQW